MLLRKIKIWDHGSLNDFIPKKKCQNGIAENLNVNGIKDNHSKQSYLLNCSTMDSNGVHLIWHLSLQLVIVQETSIHEKI